MFSYKRIDKTLEEIQGKDTKCSHKKDVNKKWLHYSVLLQTNKQTKTIITKYSGLQRVITKQWQITDLSNFRKLFYSEPCG